MSDPNIRKKVSEGLIKYSKDHKRMQFYDPEEDRVRLCTEEKAEQNQYIKMIRQKRYMKFYKVTIQQFMKDYQKCFSSTKYQKDEEELNEIYSKLVLPVRATQNSAGYDFYSPISFQLQPGETIKLPTGIKVEMNNDIVMLIFPRSSLGFRYRLQLDNTVGVIDADFFDNETNEGDILIKLTNCGDSELSIKQGIAIAQGIFTKYFTTEDDESTAVRTGGIGSTN